MVPECERSVARGLGMTDEDVSDRVRNRKDLFVTLEHRGGSRFKLSFARVLASVFCRKVSIDGAGRRNQIWRHPLHLVEDERSNLLRN